MLFCFVVKHVEREYKGEEETTYNILVLGWYSIAMGDLREYIYQVGNWIYIRFGFLQMIVVAGLVFD